MKAFRTSMALGALAALLAAAPAPGAVAAEAPDGPMATAGASGSPPAAVEVVAAAAAAPVAAPAQAPTPGRTPARPMSTAEQIDDFLKSSPAAAPSEDEMAALDEGLEPERRVHGSVEVGVGTHGYRHASVEAHYPVGKTGHVSVAVGTTRGRGVVAPCYGPYSGPFGGPGCW